MFIEEKIFDKNKANFNKIEEYGFKNKKDNYEYSIKFFNDNYKAYITIHKNGSVTGRVFDLEMDDEYTLIRSDSSKSPEVKKVKEEYKKILMDIKNKCYDK